MTEHINKNNWLNNITHLALQFFASWYFVGYIRIHILDIPYSYYNGYFYNFIATIACVAILYFFLYKKYTLKVDLEYVIFGVLISIISIWFTVQLLLNITAYISNKYINIIHIFIYILLLNPLIMYILAFINKKAFVIFTLINIAGIIAVFYT